MAVVLKGDGYSLLPLLGVSNPLITKAKDWAVTVEQPFPGSFYVKFNGQTYGSISVKGQAITLTKSGSLGPASKEALKSQFTQALESALAASMKTAKVVDIAQLCYDQGESDAMVLAEAQVLDGTASEKAKVKMSQGTAEGIESLTKPKSKIADEPSEQEPKSFHNSGLDWEDDPVKVMTNGSLMPLASSKTLYQPVYGTSGGSVYITVALLKGATMAARVTATKCSLRVEGPDVKAYQTALADLGFGYKDKDGYASVHYDISDDGLLLKTFGAVLGRLGLNRVKAYADIMLTKGYGK